MKIKVHVGIHQINEVSQMGDWEVDVYLNRNSLILSNGIGYRIQLEFDKSRIFILVSPIKSSNTV